MSIKKGQIITKHIKFSGFLCNIPIAVSTIKEYKKTPTPLGESVRCFGFKRELDYLNVNSAKFAAVFGILFNVKSNFLTFCKSFEAVGYDSGEVNEDIFAVFIAGNKAETFLVVKPFYCTLIHSAFPPKIYYTLTNKKHMSL